MYPADRHLTLLWRYEELQSIRSSASFCRVSKSTAQRWIKEYHTKEKSKIRKPRIPYRLLKVKEFVKEWVIVNPFMTCKEIASKLSVSKELVRRCLHVIGFSYKNARYFGRAKNAYKLTCNFLEMRDKYIQEDRPIYSIDETGFGRFSYCHRKGWSKKGHRLIVQKHLPRETSTSVIACASKNAWEQYTKHKGGTSRAKFCSFLKALDLPKHSVIILDNASIHKGDDITAILEERQWDVLYSPPYSPWFNPIEGCFSIVKHHYPNIQNIDKCFDLLTPEHFKSFFDKYLNTYGVNEVESDMYKKALGNGPQIYEDMEMHQGKKRKCSIHEMKNVTLNNKRDIQVHQEDRKDGTTLVTKSISNIVEKTTTTSKKTIVECTTTTRTTSFVKPTKGHKKHVCT